MVYLTLIWDRVRNDKWRDGRVVHIYDPSSIQPARAHYVWDRDRLYATGGKGITQGLDKFLETAGKKQLPVDILTQRRGGD